MANKIPTALVSDFDGTISDDDFSIMSAAAGWAKKRWIPGGNIRREKDSFEALREIFASLRVEQPAFDDFIREIKIDPGFLRLPTIAAGGTFLFTSARPAATITSISWRERRWPTAG